MIYSLKDNQITNRDRSERERERELLNCMRLEHEGSTLGLLVTTQFEVLATLDGELHLVLALGTFQTEHNLLSGLGLLTERRQWCVSQSSVTIKGPSHLLTLPSCGRRVWFDHHNRIAYGHNVSYLERREKPYQPCIG
jgi:hypothetical protein